MKGRITSDRKFIHLTDFTEIEIEQVKHSFTKRIEAWRFHPLVKKCGNHL